LVLLGAAWALRGHAGFDPRSNFLPETQVAG
jgi:hypothetical protein